MKNALESDDPAIRSVALGAALRLGILSYKTLTNALASPSPTIQRRALEIAPRLDNQPDAAPSRTHLIARIITLLTSDDPVIAESAARALGELGSTGPAITALEHQAQHHDDPMCRESAVAALGCLAAGRSTVLAATSDVATVRRRAIIALAAFDGQEVEDALNRALTDRDWQVRQAAEDLLHQGTPD